MRLWMIIVPSAVIGGLSGAYETWSNSPPSPQTQARRECIAIADDKGLSRSEAVQVCGCIMDKATWWKRANGDAEYTRAVHNSIARPCLEKVIAKRNAPPSFGTFTSGPPPARRAPDEALMRRLEQTDRRAPVSGTTPTGTYPAPSRPEGRPAY